MIIKDDVEQGGVLACDPSKSSWGWAYAEPRAVALWPQINIGRNIGPIDGVWYGSMSFSGQRHDEFIENATTWLRDLCNDTEPREIVYEDPLHHPHSRKKGERPDSIARTRVMFSCECLILQRARIIEAETNSMAPETAKKWFTGNGWADKGVMMAQAAARGWNPAVDDEADALAILDTHIGGAEGRARIAKMEAAIVRANPKQKLKRKHWRR